MSNLAKEFEAVKLLLASFFDDPPEAERKEDIKEKSKENVQVKIYADLSKAKLQDQLGVLQVQLNGIIVFNFDILLLSINISNFIYRTII
jgi:hypothetical protein